MINPRERTQLLDVLDQAAHLPRQEIRMTVLHTGATKDYSDNWAKAFGGSSKGRRSAAKKKKKSPRQATVVKKSTKKRSSVSASSSKKKARKKK